jgi:hypothetical protein
MKMKLRSPAAGGDEMSPAWVSSPPSKPTLIKAKLIESNPVELYNLTKRYGNFRLLLACIQLAANITFTSSHQYFAWLVLRFSRCGLSPPMDYCFWENFVYFMCMKHHLMPGALQSTGPAMGKSRYTANSWLMKY